MAALQVVSTTHYSKRSDGCPDQLIGAYLAGLSNPSPFARYVSYPHTQCQCCSNCPCRMGYCLALGALPRPLLLIQLKLVLEGLVGVVSHIEGCDPQYAEVRRDAAKAISRCAKLTNSTCVSILY